MEIKNLDLIYSTSGNRIYPASFNAFIVNQYATNYKIRVGIYYGDQDMTKLIIRGVKAVIYNGKSNPARILYNDETTTYSGKSVNLYTYQLTQYDTYLYNDTLEITIIVTLHDGTEFVDTISVPMSKQYFGKITPQPLEDDGTLNSVIEGTNVMREDINRILEGGGSNPAEILPEPDSIVLRDQEGRSKINTPAAEYDIANKKYIDENFVEKYDAENILYGTDSEKAPKALSYGTGTTGNIIVQRNTEGQIAVPVTPTAIGYATSKSYVDKTASAKAAEALNSANTYTDEKIADLIDSSPGTLNTLNELAAALGDDPNFATTIINRIAEDERIISSLEAGKVDKLTAEGTGLVYAVNPKGVTVGIPLTEDPDAESVPLRLSNGGIIVSDDPVDDYEATPKNYVDTLHAKTLLKPETTSALVRAIVIPANSKSQSTLDIANTDSNSSGGKIPVYRTGSGGVSEPSGKLVTGTPVQKYQAATKKYVDDSVAGAINGTVKAGDGISISTSNSVSTITNTKELYSYYLHNTEPGDRLDITFIAPKLEGMPASGTRYTNSTQAAPLLNYLNNNGFNTLNNLLMCSGNYSGDSSTNSDPVVGMCYMNGNVQVYVPSAGRYVTVYVGTTDGRVTIYYTRII